ncbi:hypothetical protein L596_001072 [Steinernema carpocapsae]|uniref:Uncharacterized protein n=1 Tax=Steinernema carpocapsae TaxID=34508 RepID=A0A4V6I793_STECR|nr:hypothetical protein L596_001072 [Steinernema carpocapsae]
MKRRSSKGASKSQAKTSLPSRGRPNTTKKSLKPEKEVMHIKMGCLTPVMDASTAKTPPRKDYKSVNAAAEMGPVKPMTKQWGGAARVSPIGAVNKSATTSLKSMHLDIGYCEKDKKNDGIEESHGVDVIPHKSRKKKTPKKQQAASQPKRHTGSLARRLEEEGFIPFSESEVEALVNTIAEKERRPLPKKRQNWLSRPFEVATEGDLKEE